MPKPPLKPEQLDQIEEVTEEDLKAITGGKSAMPSSKLGGYRLLKISETALGSPTTAPTTKLK